MTSNVRNYAAVFGRELGVFALLLAVLGLLASLTWRRNVASYPVFIAFLANLIAAKVVVDFGGYSGGFDTDLITEGFILGCYFALACWVAIGATQLVGVAGWARSSDRVADHLKRPLAVVVSSRVFVPIAASVLGVAIVVPLVLGNWSGVHRSTEPFAGAYAQTALNELPPHAAVFILGAELTQPLIYRQVVYHQRPDVAVIAADGLEFDWYTQQLSRRLGIHLAPPTGNTLADAARTIRAVARVRPVYLDPQATRTFGNVVGYRPVGLLAQLAPGHGQAPVSAPGQAEGRLLAAERSAGFPNHNWNIWPNNYVAQAEYAGAALHIAQAFYQHHDYAGMRSALLNELTVRPGDPGAEKDLALLSQQGYGG